MTWRAWSSTRTGSWRTHWRGARKLPAAAGLAREQRALDVEHVVGQGVEQQPSIIRHEVLDSSGEPRSLTTEPAFFHDHPGARLDLPQAKAEPDLI